MIRFPCGTCGKRLRVPARLAGKRGRCERCGAVNRVPMADVPPEPAAEAQPGRATAVAAPPPPPKPARQAPAPPKSPAGRHAETAPAAEAPPAVEAAKAADAPRAAEAVVPQLDPAPPSEAVDAEEWADRSPGPGDLATPTIPPATGAVDEVGGAATSPAAVDDVAAIPEVNFVDDASAVGDEGSAIDVDVARPQAEGVTVPPQETATTPPATAPGASSPVLAVDVRRAEGPSPFRSTADVTARETIETTVNLPDAQFAADGRPIAVVEGADANRTVENFLEVVSRRIGVVGRAEAAARPSGDDEVPPMRILHVDVDVIEDDPPGAAPPTSPAWRPPHAAPPAPPQRLERGPVIVALLVGLILGFCAGLLASEWL